jgi:hypothetical protein
MSAGQGATGGDAADPVRENSGAGAATLVVVDEDVLELLVEAAVTDAAADEVTPPSTADGRWSDDRVAWLRQFHRERRPGLRRLGFASSDPAPDNRVEAVLPLR